VDTDERLRNRVVIVTGAAQGQGAAEAAALAAAGAQVVAADVRPVASRPAIHPHELDVADPAAWDDLTDWIAGRFGRVDGLVNNAAINSRERVGAVTLDTWNRILAVNVTARCSGCRQSCR
jgi:3alpha(or 20beta)-hydroxysteroid dehydrogenase